jgi:hypothetical protein
MGVDVTRTFYCCEVHRMGHETINLLINSYLNEYQENLTTYVEILKFL